MNDGDEYLGSLAKEIRRAQHAIDLEVYIFSRDRFGAPILQLLSAAARRGVRVRLLVDGFGSKGLSYDDLRELRDAGGKAAFYHPLPWQRTSGFRRVRIAWGRLNLRNHRKTCVMDGRVAFVGGMNINEAHLRSAHGDRAWRDTTVRVEGADVSILARAFDHAWRRTARAVSAGDAPVRLNLTQKQRAANYGELVGRIMRARERVWITNPYFVPGLSLVRALRFAAWAKTDVRLLVPAKSDVWPMTWAIRAFYRVLLGAGVKVFEFGPPFLHAKTVLIDHWACVGSSNLNQRSLFHDLEGDVILTQPASVRALVDQFTEDLRSAREQTHRRAWKRSLVQRFLEKFVLLFRRWL